MQKSQRAKTLPESIADGIGKAKDLNCKIILLKLRKNLNFVLLLTLQNFDCSMTFKFLSIFHDFPGKFIFIGFSMTVGTL